MSKTILVVGSTMWGKGETLEEALNRMVEQSPRFDRYIVYESEDKDASVDEMGNIVHAQGTEVKKIDKVIMGFDEWKALTGLDDVDFPSNFGK